MIMDYTKESKIKISRKYEKTTFGIIDVPYVIYKDNKDNYPLMEPLMINYNTSYS
jgi:hypothetical protein